MRNMRRLTKALAHILLTAVAGAVFSGMLTQVAPGYGTSEAELDPHLSRETIAARTAEAPRPGGARFILHYLAGVGRGKLGLSSVFQRPVLDLIRDRLRPTGALLAEGLAGAWLLALVLGASAALWRSAAWDFGLGLTAALCLCTPAGVVGLALFAWGGPPAAGMALLVFPHLFQYVRNSLRQILSAPHVLAARARGLSGLRILCRYALPAAAPQLGALAALSLTLGIGTAIPLEALCDIPGLGQLFWRCALARDLNVIVNLTVLIAIALQIVNQAAELLVPRRAHEIA